MHPIATPTPIDESLLPTADDIRFYQEHGWFISKPLFDAPTIHAAVEAADAFYAGRRDGHPPVALKDFLNWRPELGMDRVRMNDHIVFQSNVIRSVALAPVVGAIAARLAQTSEVRLFNSSMAYKPPVADTESGRIGWHTDRAYWQTCTSDNMLTAWIPLHDCTVDMGPVSFVDKSHTWDSSDPMSEELRSGKTFLTDDFAGLQDKLEGLGRPFKTVPAVMKAGQVSFHHCGLFHGSLANQSDRPRRNLIVHMQDAGNRYRRVEDSQGNPISYNTDSACRSLSNGDPDYSDPALFPVIWRG